LHDLKPTGPFLSSLLFLVSQAKVFSGFGTPRWSRFHQQAQAPIPPPGYGDLLRYGTLFFLIPSATPHPPVASSQIRPVLYTVLSRQQIKRVPPLSPGKDLPPFFSFPRYP